MNYPISTAGIEFIIKTFLLSKKYRIPGQVASLANLPNNFLQNVENEGIPPNSFYEAGITLILLSCFSHFQLCATPETEAHQAPPSLGFSRQEHWNGLPFPSPVHESEKWKWSRSVVSDPQRPYGLQPTRLLRPWDFPSKSTGVGCHCLLRL